jgi:hypothetical protein
MRAWLSPVEWLEWWMVYPLPVMFVAVMVMIIVFPARHGAIHPEPGDAEAANLLESSLAKPGGT